MKRYSVIAILLLATIGMVSLATYGEQENRETGAIKVYSSVPSQRS